MWQKILFFSLSFLFVLNGNAQDDKNLQQVIRGEVVDKQTQAPLPGANIVLLETNPPVGTITGAEGEFRLENVPVGRQEIVVSFIGYHNKVIKNLDFTKAHHWVLGFDALLTDHLRLKAETYYQYLYDVPVEEHPSYYSMLNAGANWGLNTRDFLTNEGEGWNYGVEFTLEKFYHNNWYFLTMASLFDSK